MNNNYNLEGQYTGINNSEELYTGINNSANNNNSGNRNGNYSATSPVMPNTNSFVNSELGNPPNNMRLNMPTNYSPNDPYRNESYPNNAKAPRLTNNNMNIEAGISNNGSVGGRRSRSRNSRKGNRKGGRKNRKSRSSRKGSRKSKKSRKNRKGCRKNRKGSRKNRK